MSKYSINLHDSSVLPLQYISSENIEHELKIGNWVKESKEILKEKNGSGVIDLYFKTSGFLLENDEYYEIYRNKIVVVKNGSNKFVFMQMLENKDVESIKFKELKKIEKLSISGDIDVYETISGQVIKIDVLGRYGEYFQSMQDYLDFHKDLISPKVVIMFQNNKR